MVSSADLANLSPEPSMKTFWSTMEAQPKADENKTVAVISLTKWVDV